MGDNNPTSYKYQQLKSPTSIRLISLLPNETFGSDIHLQLREIDILNPEDFEALSYTWGDATYKRRIHCDNGTLRVTKNCEMGLQNLRLSDKPRSLWVDAICINQEDTEERNQQVRIMGDIYKSARQVLIWLGRRTRASDAAVHFLSGFQQALKLRGAERADFVGSKVKLLREIDSHMMPPGESILGDIAKRSWFERVWTIQEVGLARKATIFFSGSSSMDWDVLVYAAYRIMKYVEEGEGILDSTGSLWEAADLHQSVTELFSSRIEVSHLRSLAPKDLKSILLSTSQKEATQPKDRIFALFGILKMLNIRMAEPDYNKSLGAIYCEAARMVIEIDESLEPLAKVRGLAKKEDDIPSWADLWTPGYHATPVVSKNRFYASARAKCFFRFSGDGRRLVVRGQNIDSIKLRTSIVPMANVDDFANVKDQRLVYAMYIPSIVQMFQQWLALMHLLPKFPEYDSKTNAFQAFVRLLTQEGSMVHDGIMRLPELEEGSVDWYGFMIANKSGGPGMGEITELIAARSEVRPLIPSWLPEELHSLTETDEWKIMHAIDLSPKASFFHHHALLLSKLKAMFSTDEGLMGTAPHSVDVGDKIVLISGVDVPLVLRPCSSGDEYTLLGPAFVQGIMYGEKWEEAKPLTEFTII